MVTWLFTQILRQTSLEPVGSQYSPPQPSISSDSYHKSTVFSTSTQSNSVNLYKTGELGTHCAFLCLVNRTFSFAARAKLYHTFNYDDSFNHQHRP